MGRIIGIWLIILIVLSGPCVAIQGASVGAQDPQSVVSVAAPSVVHCGFNFDVDISVQAVTGFTAYQFDLNFDNSTMQILGAEGGSGVSQGLINGTAIQLDGWGFIPAGTPGGTVRVLGRVPGKVDISGSGYLARVHFRALGTPAQNNSLSLARVKLIDMTTKTIASSSQNGSVNIIPPSPVITSVVPSSCEQGVSGLTIQINGTNLDGASAANISLGAGISIDNIISSSSNTINASISLATTAAVGPRDMAVTTPGGTFTLAGGFTVLAASPPTVMQISPSDSAIGINVSTVITAVFSKSMLASSLDSSSFSLKNGAVAVVGNVTYDAGSKTATFTPGWNLAYSTAYTASVKTSVTDLSGNHLAADRTWTFTTLQAPDNTPPSVNSVSPAQNESGVEINRAVTAVFSEAVQSSTINASNFTLSSSGGPVSGVLSYDSTAKTGTLTPSSNLAYSTVYTATIKTGVTDLAGNHLAADRVWTFTTREPPDTTAPILTGFSPVDGATGVLPASVITAVFSEPLKLASLGVDSFSLANSGTKVVGVALYSPDNYTLTFTPSSALERGAVYTATIGNGITDLAGNLFVTRSWSFTTVPVTDSNVNFNVALQGSSRPDTGWAVPLTVKLFQPGADVLAVAPIRTFQLNAAKTGNLASGAASVVPYGTYDVTISAPHCLTSLKKGVILTTPSASIDMGVLLEGDSDGNNAINILDFGIMASGYGKMSGQAGYDERADLDNNGVINISDFGLLAANYGKTAPVEIP